MKRRYHRQHKIHLSMDAKLCLIGLPVVLAFLLLYILPFMITCWYSLMDNRFSRQYVGFVHYAEIWSNKYFQLGVQNTILITAMTVGCTALLAIVLAYLLYHNKSFVPVCMGLMLLPMLMPSVSVTAIWRVVFNTSSFSDTWSAYMATVSLFIWKYMGIATALLYIALLDVPQGIIDAAMIDGAGRLKVFLRILLPYILGQISFTLLVLLMYSFQLYKEVYLLFGEYPCDAMYMIQHYISNHFSKLNFQNVASSAVSLTTLSVCFYSAVFLWMKRIKTQKEGA